MRQIKVDFGKKNYKTEESFKTLRTNLMLSGMNHGTIMVTSCIPNEGESTISLSLAKSLAENGKRVLVIDADLRKSVIEGKICTDEEIKGLSHFLLGSVDENEVIYRTQEEKLDIVMAGEISANPTELLGQDNFEEFVNSAKKVYDHIIINTPPLGSVIDAAIVARVCDGIVWVLSAGKISYKFARAIKAQIKKTKCPILGVVLCNADMKNDKYYNKYYGEYGKNIVNAK